jgi:hypothetical protein
MDSRRTGGTVPGVGDARRRFSRAALPVVLVGVALAAVATVGDGGVGRAHYLRQLVFGPAGSTVSRPAPQTVVTVESGPSMPAVPLAERTLPRSSGNGHRARPRRGSLLGPGGLPRRAGQPPR